MMMKRALLSCSDKTGLEELAHTLAAKGVELFASGQTREGLLKAGLDVKPVEQLSGSPEAFQGRMKTLSFPIFGGILARRGDAKDDADLTKLGIKNIDVVVVNFYPFEKAKPEAPRQERIELIDIGGPALVRAAAKNAPDVLVLTDPSQYAQVITELKTEGTVSKQTNLACAARAWTRIKEYDQAIDAVFGEAASELPTELRYGENPHQKAWVTVDADAPIAWNKNLTPQALSYNNILDCSAAYSLLRDLKKTWPKHAHVVIVKHNNPCGVASVELDQPQALKKALELAWEGDPVSAFGGVLAFSEPMSLEIATFFESRFVELIAAPGLKAKSPELDLLLLKRKNIKAVNIEHFETTTDTQTVTIPGGKLVQQIDQNLNETLTAKTSHEWTPKDRDLGQFGILVTRSLKSNAITLVRSIDNGFQLVGAGQGQPNRIDAIKTLAIPRARAVTQNKIEDCILISDAFFPFTDSIDVIAAEGIKKIIQPGGSIKDPQVIEAAQAKNIQMAFTNTRHFRH